MHDEYETKVYGCHFNRCRLTCARRIMRFDNCLHEIHVLISWFRNYVKAHLATNRTRDSSYCISSYSSKLVSSVSPSSSIYQQRQRGVTQTKCFMKQKRPQWHRHFISNAWMVSDALVKLNADAQISHWDEAKPVQKFDYARNTSNCLLACYASKYKSAFIPHQT